ncbi:hypothetical protein LTR10_006454 [Elasticomyces elasticus]|nr:hypothetical protein LTR10_006454 [Elasticomyces elasticus]KAK4973151.1 hypothetical protein LTR42_006445 [Elasticomyces elasticus]
MSGIKYTPLDVSRKEIRVLDLLPGFYRSPIKCRLRTVSIADSNNLPYYAGLSYTWGAPLPSKTISVSVGGKDYLVEIGLNLFRALQGLRSHWKKDTIWVDALGINQADNDERASQVSFMGEVYSRASTVYIWLGTTFHLNSPQHELTSVHRMMLHCSFLVPHVPKGLISFAARAPSKQYERWLHRGFHLDDIELIYLKAYRNVFFMGLSAAPYRIEKALQNSTPCWTERAWVVQEFALSHSPQICFDRTKLSYERYRSYGSRFIVPEVCRSSQALSNYLWVVRDRFGKDEDIQGPPLASNSWSPQGMLILARGAALTKTSNPHDKVFALLGMAREEEAREVAVDYNVPFWVTCVKATYASAKHNRDKWLPLGPRSARLNVLEFASWADDRPPSFPSWVADFSKLTLRTCYECFSTSFGWPGSEDHYDVSLSADLRCLTTYGVIFDSVATSFELYSRLKLNSKDRWPIDAGADDNYYAGITFLTTGDSVPAVQATLLAELTSLALQSREFAAGSDPSTSKLQAEKLSSLILQLDRQRKDSVVGSDDALDTLRTCFDYWQSVLSSQQSPCDVPWDPRSYELEMSDSFAFGFFHSIRVFASTDGYVGFAPGKVRPRDTIVFLRGAEWPAVLRHYEDRWIFRGFIYLCGVMNGELKGAKDDSSWEVQPFVLC